MTDNPTDPPVPTLPTDTKTARVVDATDVASTVSRPCPTCGTDNEGDARFCEVCGTDLNAPAEQVAPTRLTESAAAAGGAEPNPPGMPLTRGPVVAPATPQTAPAGEESPLDVGWTGPVPSTHTAATAVPEVDLTCQACGEGQIVDGYCDQCGTPPPNPRDHYTESPAAWVGGVCDIGKRHSRNEDALALSAAEGPGSRAVLVVCDGVSLATDSHIASLAAAQAARGVLDQPLPKGVGTREAWVSGAGRALTTAVERANAAVIAAVPGEVPNPPSCTLSAAIVEDGVIVAGNVGDSRSYWLPDALDEPARQLHPDDSYAHEQIASGVSREEAETGPHAHSITRWLGKDAPDDLTPHLATVVSSPGWLLVCSDGLWNYCSEAQDLRALLHETVDRLGPDQPTALAQALVDFANAKGGRDNITVALARLAGQGSNTGRAAAGSAAPEEGATTHG